MKPVGPRLGKDFDPAEAQFVVLRGEWILVDPDLTDGVFRRQFTAAETVDQDRPAARPGGRAGECLKVHGKVVRVVGERIQIGSAEHRCARVGRRLQANGRLGILVDRYLLFLRRNVQDQIHSERGCAERKFHRLANRQLRCGRPEHVVTGSEISKEVVSIVAGFRGLEKAGRAVKFDSAPGTMAPLSSVTWPRNTAVSAKAGSDSKSAKIT